MKPAWRRLATGAAALALLAGLGGFMANRGPLATPHVSVAQATVKDLHASVFGIGTVEARHAYVIGPTQAGRVLRLGVDQGDRVVAGQLLGEIDPVDLDERMAAAGLAAQRAQWLLKGAEAQARETESRAKTTAASLARYRDLAAKGFISKEMLEAKGHEADAAAASLDAALAGVDAARREVAKAGAEREALARQRANLRLLSPADGVVVAREAEPGNTVVAGQAVLRVVDSATLWVRTRIDQGRAGDVAVGQRALIVPRSHARTPLPGKVARIELQSDSVTEEQVVHVAFDSVPSGISLGGLAEVTIELAAAKGALSVPAAAIKRRDGQQGVWRIADGRARFVPVKTGIADLEGETQVLRGLRAGDEVIVHSPLDLAEGMKVRQ